MAAHAARQNNLSEESMTANKTKYCSTAEMRRKLGASRSD
jgi:hypothetical protein